MTAVLAKTSLPLGTRPNIKKLSTVVSGTAKIYCQGGSITYGYPPDDEAWIKYLAELLTAAGVAYSLTGPYASAGSPSYSCGAIIGSSIKAFSQSQANDVGIAPRRAHSEVADVIVLECTVNTANDATETSTWRADVKAYCQYVRGFNATARFVILSTQDAGDDTRRTRIATIQGEFAALATDLDGVGLSDAYVIADVQTICRDTDQMSAEAIDQRVHMNTRGAQRMASNVFPALMNALGRDAVWP